MNKGSVMFAIQGIDKVNPRMVAREDLINIFAGMAQSDLLVAHTELMEMFTVTIDKDHYTSMDAGGLLRLLEIHTRAANALQALLALRDPDELVEAHMP